MHSRMPQLFSQQAYIAQHFLHVGEFVFLQRVFHVLVHAILFPISTHECTPECRSFFRSKRTARNIRSFTAPAEMPSASAISAYDSSSINPSCATTRRR